jgi:hypothetical protein
MVGPSFGIGDRQGLEPLSAGDIAFSVEDGKAILAHLKQVVVNQQCEAHITQLHHSRPTPARCCSRNCRVRFFSAAAWRSKSVTKSLAQSPPQARASLIIALELISK